MKIVTFILLLVLGISSTAQTIDVNIVDVHKKAIPNSRVLLIEFEQYYLADTLGNCQIEFPDTGAYKIQVSAYGFMTQQVEIQVVEGAKFEFVLEHNHRQLDQLIVHHTGELQGENITNVAHLKLGDLNQIQTTTLGASLAKIPGVYQTGLGNGISKPVIRGLSGSSVVTYLNLLRIENQQWGGDHGLPITSLGIGSVEVIKGPSSLLFGADALGGVLYFVDAPYAPKNSYAVEFNSRFESNTMGTANQLGVKLNKKNIRMNLYLGYDNHADFKLANDNFVQNSRFNQYSGKLSVGYNTKKWLFNLRYNFYQGQIGLPGETHDSIPTPASFQTTKQERNTILPSQLITNNFLSIENKFYFKRSDLIIAVGNTNNQIKEFEEDLITPAIDINLNNTLINAKWKYRISDKTQLILGSQEMFQFNLNAAGAEEQLIPNATTIDYGAFALLISNIKKWRVQAGLRADNRTIEANADDFSKNFSGYNFALGFARIHEKSSLRINVSSGFRAPTSAELLSNGVHHGAFRYERGNQNLTTEKAVQIDLSYAMHYKDFEIIMNPYYNRIFDYIYLKKAGELVEGFEAYDYFQTNFAQLYGLDFGIHYHPHQAHWLHLESNLSTLFAEDEFKAALSLIPQSRINNQIRIDFKMEGKFSISNIIIQQSYYFKQNRLGQLESETENFQLIDLGLNAKLNLKHPIMFGIGVNNLLDENYINHLSGLKNLGLANPGRNFYISLKYNLSNPFIKR